MVPKDSPEPTGFPDDPRPGALVDDLDLRDSLTDLSLLATPQLGMSDMLIHVAEFAVRAIPGADGAGVTLFQHELPDTVVASDDFVTAVDALQYDLGEGPCITAAIQRRTVRSGSLANDPIYPRFGPRTAQLGIYSALSLPLLTDGGVLGTMNVYARAENAFADRAVDLGELYAIPAAISVQNAQALWNAQRLAAQLQTALANRPAIDQAIGILISRTGATAAEAFAKLRAMSQNENRKVSEVAQLLVDEAMHRARGRRHHE